jgi:hypothetical protein
MGCDCRNHCTRWSHMFARHGVNSAHLNYTQWIRLAPAVIRPSALRSGDAPTEFQTEEVLRGSADRTTPSSR